MRARHGRRKKTPALKSFNFLAWVRSAKTPGRNVMDDVRKPSLKSLDFLGLFCSAGSDRIRPLHDLDEMRPH